jgi:hypothetical protein
MLRSSLDHQRGLAASLDRSFKHRRKVLAIHAADGDSAKPGMFMRHRFNRRTHPSRHWLLHLWEE